MIIMWLKYEKYSNSKKSHFIVVSVLLIGKKTGNHVVNMLNYYSILQQKIIKLFVPVPYYRWIRKVCKW